MHDDALSLAGERWRVEVLPRSGASLATGQVRLGDRWVDLLRPTPPSDRHVPARCASSVLVPFSNRVRDGVLRYGGRQWRLRRNADDGTTLHGVGHEHAWDVVDASEEHVTLRLDTRAVGDVNFPWRFVAEVTYRVEGARLVVGTALTSADGEPFPVGFGHHPYFRRGLVDASSEVRLRVPCEAAWPLERAMATGPAGAVPPHADHRAMRALDGVFVDECLTARVPGEPVRIEWPRSGVAVTMRADDVFRQVVLYAPTGRPWFAVEPVTNANDAFNLLADGVPGHGLVELAPGERVAGEWSLELEDL